MSINVCSYMTPVPGLHALRNTNSKKRSHPTLQTHPHDKRTCFKGGEVGETARNVHLTLVKARYKVVTSHERLRGRRSLTCICQLPFDTWSSLTSTSSFISILWAPTAQIGSPSSSIGRPWCS